MPATAQRDDLSLLIWGQHRQLCDEQFRIGKTRLEQREKVLHHPCGGLGVKESGAVFPKHHRRRGIARYHEDDEPGPLTGLRHENDDQHQTGHQRAEEVEAGAPLPPRRSQPSPASDEPGLGEREGQEHADRVEGDELGDAALTPHQDRRRDDRQRDDPEGECEPLPAIRELARHEAVVREHRCQAREAGESGVRGERQQERGRSLNDVIQRRVSDERPRQKAVERLGLGAVGDRADRLREERQSEEDRAEGHAHHDQSDRGVPALVLLHAGHPIGDRLASGEADRA